MNHKLKQLNFRSLEIGRVFLYATSLLVFSASLSVVIFATTLILSNVVDVIENQKLGLLSFLVCFVVLSAVGSISKKLILGDYSFFVLPRPSKSGSHFYIWVPFSVIFSLAFVYIGTILFDFDFEVFALNGANIVMFSGWASEHVEAVLGNSSSRNRS